ncbi:hypothetical protein [Micromonospora sp. NBC_00858]|uniref:hypothetical protein n=1 Tax=Micromonospora sp. NBC_00858 TaxID=2975979 RepID=UPI00386C0CCC|nr:hypothetical protein OG990_03440 [Micromonospora sp. NBC_00858]
MKPPSKLCTTRYRPLIAGGRSGARVVDLGRADGLTVGARDPAARLGGSPVARGDSPGSNGRADDVGAGPVGGTGVCGNGSVGADASSGAGLRPRYAPRTTKSSTTITTTPAHTTIQGDDVMATGPWDGRGARRMPDMYLPQRAVRAA